MTACFQKKQHFFTKQYHLDYELRVWPMKFSVYVMFLEVS